MRTNENLELLLKVGYDELELIFVLNTLVVEAHKIDILI